MADAPRNVPEIQTLEVSSISGSAWRLSGQITNDFILPSDLAPIFLVSNEEDMSDASIYTATLVADTTDEYYTAITVSSGKTYYCCFALTDGTTTYMANILTFAP